MRKGYRVKKTIVLLLALVLSGMVMIVAPYYADSILTRLRRAGEHAQIVGRVVRGKRTVTIE